jgi:DNA-binding MurR/RpiR family transcriptional regulator
VSIAALEDMMYQARIRANYDNLSKSQKRIADYLLTSQREAAFMTASRLATILDVDVATITRFAQRLGYPGYPELLAEVQQSVREEMIVGGRPLGGTNERGRTFMRALAAETEHLERTLNSISIESVERALDVLSQARSVYLIGQSTGEFMAHNLMLRLMLLGYTTTLVIGDEVALSFVLRAVGPGDVVIGCGFSGYARDVAAALQIGRERGATAIAISGSEVSAVARSADIAILCSATSPMALPSETAVTAVIESIFATLGAERQQSYRHALKEFSDTHELLIKRKSETESAPDDSFMKIL